jgi:hypothetical protein
MGNIPANWQWRQDIIGVVWPPHRCKPGKQRAFQFIRHAISIRIGLKLSDRDQGKRGEGKEKHGATVIVWILINRLCCVAAYEVVKSFSSVLHSSNN